MQKFKMITLLLIAFLFVGCSQKKLEVEDVKEQDITHYFQYGVIISSQKVLVDRTKLSVLKYATGGAVGGTGIGAMIGGSQGGAIGAMIGTAVGGLFGATGDNEIEAFKMGIKNVNTGEVVVAYLGTDVLIGSLVEYVSRNQNQITNVNIVETQEQLAERLKREEKEAKRKRKKR